MYAEFRGRPQQPDWAANALSVQCKCSVHSCFPAVSIPFVPVDSMCVFEKGNGARCLLVAL